ncbi:MAG: hypothetical protein IJP75_01760 [Bacteroidaceae bacterium]|nr:hypothetical protein [Bacteroidaceae bacterium]
MLIAVDFDGTIVEHEYPQIGEERPFATEVLKMLIAERHKVVLWTMREGQLLDDAVKWCAERGVEFYAVNSEYPAQFMEAKPDHLSCKLNADVFIDDRNVGGLPDWPTIYKIITRGKNWKQMIRAEVMSEYEEEEPPYPKWMFWKTKKK